MYASHPETNRLARSIPETCVAEARNEQKIPWATFLEMRACISRLADLAEEWNPDLILFFATGGVPYAFPMMAVLQQRRVEAMMDGRFHMFPGLAWEGKIDGMSSAEYFISQIRPLLTSIRQRPLQCSSIRILSFDTANSGSGMNGLLGRLDEAVTESDGVVETKVVVIVNHAKALTQKPDDTKIEVGSPLGSVWLQKPPGHAESAVVVAFDWYQLATSSPQHQLALSYWPYSCVPTEDESELMGVDSFRDHLGVESSGQLGRIVLTAESGSELHISGSNAIGDRLFALLAMPDEEDLFGTLRQQAGESLPAEEQAEVNELRSSAHDIFDVGWGSREKTIERLHSLSRLWTAPEVFRLARDRRLLKTHRSKLKASVSKADKPDECLDALRQARPDLCRAEPSDLGCSDLLLWWVDQVCQ